MLRTLGAGARHAPHCSVDGSPFILVRFSLEQYRVDRKTVSG